jgi:exonuclease III
MQVDEFGEPAIGELAEWNQVENVILRLPPDKQWMHYQKKRGASPASCQLDHLLVSKSLAQATDAQPDMLRKGLAKNADRYTGPRFPKVGTNKPIASDHCPVVIELKL